MGGQVFSAVGQAHWLWQVVYRIAAARPSPRVSGAVGRKLGTNAASAEKSVRAHSSSRHSFGFGVTVVCEVKNIKTGRLSPCAVRLQEEGVAHVPFPQHNERTPLTVNPPTAGCTIAHLFLTSCSPRALASLDHEVQSDRPSTANTGASNAAVPLNVSPLTGGSHHRTRVRAHTLTRGCVTEDPPTKSTDDSDLEVRG